MSGVPAQLQSCESLDLDSCDVGRFVLGLNNMGFLAYSKRFKILYP